MTNTDTVERLRESKPKWNTIECYRCGKTDRSPWPAPSKPVLCDDCEDTALATLKGEG